MTASPFGYGKKGMALVITLAALVLLTIVILAFFSRAQLQRQIAYSYAGLMRSDSLARSALDIVAGEIREEIAAPDHSGSLVSSNLVIYQPRTAEDFLPRKIGVASPDAAGAATLLKVSSDGNGVRPGGPANLKASPVAIDAPAQGGRFLSLARWFGSGGPGLGSQNALPAWMLVTRGNGVALPTLADAKNVSAGDFVIGRFAYTVYDIGGLLDANAAGYPSGVSAADLAGVPASADLGVLGLPATALADWRNAGTGSSVDTFREWATGIPRISGSPNAAALAAFRDGHRSMVAGDNAVLSRQDLLKNPKISTAAAYLTHFSRTLNAPSWRPLNPAGYAPSPDYEARSDDAASINRNLPNVRVSTSFTRLDGRTAQPGEALVDARFPLSRLAWLKDNNRSTAAFDACPELQRDISFIESLRARNGAAAIPGSDLNDKAGWLIRRVFGLEWQSSIRGWKYAEDASTIKRLNQVAGREPNFFELLQAGILEGSLGLSGSDGASDTVHDMARSYGVETNKLYQLIRIGINMVDQYDRDSYPTCLVFNDLQFYGIEDLPYLNKVIPKVYWPNYADDRKPPVDIYMAYELWNPHQAAASSERPERFRVRINPDAAYRLSVKARSPSDGHTEDFYPFGSSSQSLSGVGGDPLEFTSDTDGSDVQSSYREPRMIRTGQSSTWRATLGCNAVQLPSITSVLPASWINNPTDWQMWVIYGWFRTVFILEYLDEDNQWRPYSTFAGHEENQGVSGIGGTGMNGDWISGFPEAAVGRSYAMLKTDPRTFRFGIQLSWVRLAAASPNGILAPAVPSSANFADTSLHPSASVNRPAFSYMPRFMYTSPVPFQHDGYLSFLSSNKGASDPNNRSYSYSDNDAVLRPGDAWYDVNPYEEGVTSARPVILNRPFRSVGELGYVFRDMPFKTLDLFTARSADAGLADMFCLAEESRLVGGRAALNTRQSLTQESLLGGLANADALAASFQSYAFSGGSPAANLPRTVGQLADFLFSDPPGLDDRTKTGREAVVRSLAGASQSRTWNLLIDLVAQSGRYPRNATSLDQFLVEGEKRYWLSLAIDRLTGDVIDYQLEPVNE
ncbi:MAG: hypothetical protein J0I10_23180 [Verrucomicrobia bacterium]|nr:hypothetical protein [Verrucomicrobiota bacterium]